MKKFNFGTGEFEDLFPKTFEDYTVGELCEVIQDKSRIPAPPGLEPVAATQAMEPEWYDEVHFFDDDEELEKDGKFPGELPNMSQSYKSEGEKWNGQNWIKVRSVVDSGASAPVAPPSMAPNVPVEPSPGSRRGQKYASASKHKIKNLGQQKLKACTENGSFTEVLFQIADVSRPLVSVSGICEMGNRVVFGKGGGVVQNLRTGRQTPFYRQNGIYVLDMWLLDEPSSSFTRP